MFNKQSIKARCSNNFKKNMFFFKSKPQKEESEPIQDYDPHANREVRHPTTNFETIIHLLKCSLGTGILAMPQAFYNAGYLNGFIATVLIGMLCTYGVHILVRSQYILCKRYSVPMLTYQETLKKALEHGPHCLRKLAKAAPVTIDTFMLAYQLGICCVYIVFISTTIKTIVDYYLAELDVRLYMLMILLPLILMNCVRNLKRLAPFSTLANALTFLGLGMILYYIFQDFPSPLNREPFGELKNFSLFFGTTLFALEAVGVILALENNMLTPKSFGGYFGVLNLSMFIIVSLYAGMGFLGYIKYGADVEASITLNLPSTEIVAQILKCLFAVCIFVSYALQCYVPVEIIWKNYLAIKLENSDKKLMWEFVTRIGIVLGTFIIAVGIPHLGLFISLAGSLLLSALGLIFPAVIDLCVLWPDWGKYNQVLIRDIGIITVGFFAMIAGTYSSIRDILSLV